MHLNCGCDNQEGNLCNKCETEMHSAKHAALYDDGWWPRVAVGTRSINTASSVNVLPPEYGFLQQTHQLT